MKEELIKRQYIGIATYSTYKNARSEELVVEGKREDIKGYTFMYSADEIKTDNGRLQIGEYCDFEGEVYIVKEKTQQDERLGKIDKSSFDIKYGNRI